ncbi:MAG: hypothetical protein GF308_15875, partial [Candidatus Heimdallarchaeota archaeon]|nr:hypothetical protein [Candidatus Heimdallarchaeota archaeon]
MFDKGKPVIFGLAFFLLVFCGPIIPTSQQEKSQVTSGSFSMTATIHELWTFDAGNRITASAVAVNLDDSPALEVLIPSYIHDMFCLYANGSMNWRTSTDRRITASPTVFDLDNDSHLEVIYGSQDKLLYCKTNRGFSKWNFYTGGEIHSSPVVAD